jgi:hypothetical protein
MYGVNLSVPADTTLDGHVVRRIYKDRICIPSNCQADASYLDQFEVDLRKALTDSECENILPQF